MANAVCRFVIYFRPFIRNVHPAHAGSLLITTPLDLDMALTSANTWAAYKRQERGHNSGDHSTCDPRRCSEAEWLCTRNEERLEAIALLAELKARRLNAAEFLGDDYHSTVAIAAADYPPFPYIQAEPDWVHQLQASVLIG
jgi:hypothetical protein